ncbi:MAG TPA: hypothetical protein VK974_06170 [Methylophilaceae bacterium]|nr:hypothetical protein [Methylophilaceae bacterium]
MRNKFGYSALLLVLLLNGCGGFSVWPFGGGTKAEADSYKPENSTEYLCDAGKKFYVRTIDNGAAVWLILPDREVALNKAVSSQSSMHYSNGITTLDITGSDATLDLNPTSSLKGCKQAQAPKK